MTPKLSHTVKIYVGGTTDIPSIGLASGVLTWSPEDQDQSILTDKWVSGISSSVDTSVNGNYTVYSAPSISFHSTSGVIQQLQNYGLSLSGSLVDIIETKDGIDWVMFRGICRRPQIKGNTVTLGVSHTSNYYETQMAPRIGDEYSYIAYGDSVDKVPLIFESGEVEEPTVVGDNYIPAFEVSGSSQDGVLLISKYDTDTVPVSGYDSVTEEGQSYITAGGNKDMILKALSTALPIIVDGKEYVAIPYQFIPLNLRDGDLVKALEDGATITLQRVNANKYYPPYGTDIDLDLLQYEDGGRFFKFPPYVDSLEIVGDHIEILDSDNSGDVFRAPTVTAGPAPESVPKEILPSRAADYQGDGVFSFDNDYDSHIVTNAGLYASRNNLDQVQTQVNFKDVVQGEFVSVALVYQYQYRPQAGFIPDDLFITLDNSALVTGQFGSVTANILTIVVATVSGLYEIYNSGDPQDDVDHVSNLLPLEVTPDDVSKFYRYSSPDTYSQAIGKTISAFTVEMEEFEKAAGVTVYVVNEVTLVNTTAPIVDAKTFISTKMYLAESVTYDSTSLYYSGTPGKDDSSGDTIEDTKSAYESTLELQNYEYNGITIPEAGWGLEYPVDSLSGVIGDTSNIPVIPLKYSTNEVSTKAIKLLLLRYTFGIGKIDNSGKETWASALSMYETGGYAFDKTKMKKDTVPNFVDIPDNRIYPEIGVTYANGNITVTNVEQDIYQAGYVTGVTDTNVAQDLWTAGRLLYQTYGVKNTYRQKLGDISGIRDEADAIQYVKNQYALTGIVFSEGIVALYKIYTCSFTTTSEFWWDALENGGVLDNNFGVGAPITLTYPHRASNHTGQIISATPNPLDAEISVTGKFVGDQLAISEEVLIIETGSQTDDITETGSQTDNYVEGP